MDLGCAADGEETSVEGITSVLLDVTLLDIWWMELTGLKLGILSRDTM